MYIYVLIVVMSAVGIAAMVYGIKLIFKNHELDGIVGIILGGLTLAWALFPFYGPFYECEYVPAGNNTYVEQCTKWREP